MDHKQTYRSKHMPEGAVLDLIADGMTIVTGAGPGLPNCFLQILAANAKRFSDVRLCHAMRREAVPIVPELTAEENVGHLFHVSDYTFDRPVIEAIRAGRATYRPNHPAESVRFFPYPVDLLVISVSPMDRHGFFSLGAFGGWIAGHVPKARRILLEVNRHQPRVLGNCQIHVNQVSAVFEADYPLTSIKLSNVQPTKEERAVAAHLADLVLDGATIQAGVGQIPDVMLRLLKDSGRKELGVHSEAMFDAMADLYEAGVITNSRKAFGKGKFVFALVVGSQRIYDFIDDNPAAEMNDIAYVADPKVIASNYRPFSINATIQIDLFGQCASETVDGRHYSGVGGQWNFHYGAAQGEEGRAVITLMSTGRGRSRIVPMLPPGSAVTIPRNDIQYVATEYGVVNLKGTALDERARALISIAHPDFREELERAAHDELRVLPRRVVQGASVQPGGAA
jgi:4-hydroxybutyrate CoA-transferase